MAVDNSKGRTFLLKLSPIALVARKHTHDLFPPLQCNYHKRKCKLKDTLVVWDDKVFKPCPFSFVEEVNLEVYEDDIMYDKKRKRVFQVVRKLFDAYAGAFCPGDIYETQQGLYLTQSSVIRKYPTINVEQRTVDELILEESDSKNLVIMKLLKELNVRTCRLISNNLKNLARTLDKVFISVNDVRDNEVVLFIANGRVWAPRCVGINNVTIKNTSLCYQDIPTTFTYKNQSNNGFLDRNVKGLIKASSIEIKCTNDVKEYHVDSENIVRTVANNQFLEKNIYKEDHEIKLSLIDFNATRLNFDHYSQILEGDDAIERFVELTRVAQEPEGNKYFITKSEHSVDSDLAISINNVFSIILNWKKYLIIALSCIIIIVIIWIMMCCCGGCSNCICRCCKLTRCLFCKCCKKRKIKRNNDVFIELEELDQTTRQLLKNVKASK